MSEELKTTPKQYDYSKLAYCQPKYVYRQLLEHKGSESVTCSLTGSTEGKFVVPASEVVNLAKSRLHFQVTIPAQGVSEYAYHHVNGISPIERVVVQARNGTVLCDISDLGTFSKVTRPALTRVGDLDTTVGASATTAENAISYCQKSRGDQTNPNLAVYTNDNIGQDLALSNSVPYYSGLEYIKVNATANEALSVNCELPLSAVKHSILSLDKSIWYGQDLYISFWFAQSTKLGFTSSSATAIADETALTVVHTITRCKMYLATEPEPSASVIKEAMMSKGLQMMIPYVHVAKQNFSSSTSCNMTARFNRGHGLRLQRLYVVMTHNTETGSGAFNISNQAGEKVTSFYSTLDSRRLQDYDLACSAGSNLDHMHLKDDYIDTIYNDQNSFKANWHWVENWTGGKSTQWEELDRSEACGVPLDVERVYTWNATTDNIAKNVIIYAVCQRQLSIAPDMIQLN